ncbi:aspartic proteinase [Colletotrichum chrysophilum]|uniref:Aspartic proteinase n=1 Tax=Colletotrichum chrysophilum TaxID=1836956 RepID=A0AAD9A1B1_9PEZI|nr:aspartic proteinase [Colletotrichum chrysophilum]
MKLSGVSAVALWAAAVTAQVRLPFTRQSHQPLSRNARRRDDERRSTSTADFFSADTVYLFEGPLTRLPILTSFSTSKVFNTRIHSINGSKSSSDVLEPLGSLGTSYNDESIVRISPHNIASWLPDDIAQDIYAIAGATWLESQSNYLHGFDGPVLNVPISDLVIPADFWSSSKWSWDTETATQYCLFGVQSDNSSTSSTSTTSGSSSSTFSLGGMMLKRAYMVFDLANEEIAIAKTKFGDGTTEDVIPFPSYAAEIPDSTSVSVVVSVYCPVGATSDECDPNGSGSGDGYGYYDSVGLSRGAKIGIGVGVGGFSLIVLALTVWAIMRCRRIRRAEAELAEKQKRVEEGTGAAADTGIDKDLNPAMSQQPPVAVKESTSMSE